MCAVRMVCGAYKLLLVNVYMSYEGNEAMTDDFADQLSVVESLINDNLDCHIVVGGDFNVDFDRQWLHTSMLSSFCDNNDINPVDRHSSCTVDYSYNLNMSRLNTLDHFLLSGTLYSNAVDSCFALHDVDNLSDHDPVVLRLALVMKLISFTNRVYSPRISWIKPTVIRDCHGGHI